MTLVDAAYRRHDLPRRAVSTLEGVVIDERLLHGMQLTARLAQTFDRRDPSTIGHHREHQTGQNASSVNQNGAGSALSVAAAFLRSRESGLIPNCIEQSGSRVHGKNVQLLVDAQRDRRPATATSRSVWRIQPNLGSARIRRQRCRRARRRARDGGAAADPRCGLGLFIHQMTPAGRQHASNFLAAVACAQGHAPPRSEPGRAGRGHIPCGRRKPPCNFSRLAP